MRFRRYLLGCALVDCELRGRWQRTVRAGRTANAETTAFRTKRKLVFTLDGVLPRTLERPPKHRLSVLFEGMVKIFIRWSMVLETDEPMVSRRPRILKTPDSLRVTNAVLFVYKTCTGTVNVSGGDESPLARASGNGRSVSERNRADDSTAAIAGENVRRATGRRSYPRVLVGDIRTLGNGNGWS